jgi:8-oxo-dGTP diphosphatase
MIKHFKSVCGIIKNEDKFFVVRQNDPDEVINFWQFPGGGIDTNESNVEALKRHLKAKLNIEITDHEDFYTQHDEHERFDVTVHSYICKTENMPQLLGYDEGKFVTIHELVKLRFTPAHFEIIGNMIFEFCE